MDQRRYYDRLPTTADDPAELFEHFEEHNTADRTLYILPDARHGLERGTVIIEETDIIVRGYPSIPRVLVLDTGIPSFFETAKTIAVEEKLDGFNVRIVDSDDPIALTRSGYICPYTTERVRDLIDLGPFFEDHPEKMLCAELVGAETPYTTHDYDNIDSHSIRVFDIRNRESGRPLAVEKRRDICVEYGFPQPRLFGRYQPTAAADEVRDVITELDAAGREGVVMKTADSSSMVKYTTEYQHHADLGHAFALPFDYGRDFIFSRTIREGFQAVEFEEDDARLRERAHGLGEAILLPMVRTIRDVKAGNPIGERHTVRGAPESIDALLDHLSGQSLTLEIEADRRESGERVITFVKIAESTRDHIEYYLEGGTRDE